MTEQSCRDLRVLVTAGAAGIGREIASAFAGVGARVAVCDIDEAALARFRAELPGHEAFECDISDEDDVDDLFDDVIDTLGGLDVLVNNAGIQTDTPGDGFDEAAFLKILGVNLIGAAYCARAAIRHFLTRPGGGVVINTSSVHEVIPKPGFLAYSISKGGLGNLTRTLALEFADRGIRVNGVGPGATMTDLNGAWTDDPVKRAAVESHIPMGRATTPEEIAPVFAFLASDEASYVTGQTLHACGGLTLFGDFKRNWSS